MVSDTNRSLNIKAIRSVTFSGDYYKKKKKHQAFPKGFVVFGVIGCLYLPLIVALELPPA